jgi:hypothetical protein
VKIEVTSGKISAGYRHPVFPRKALRPNPAKKALLSKK